MELSIIYRYLDALNNRVIASSRPIIINNPIGYNRNKGTATVSYDNQGFNARVQANRIAPARADTNTTYSCYSVPVTASFTFVNHSPAYAVNQQFTIRGSVGSQFDVSPPGRFPAATEIYDNNPAATCFWGILGSDIHIGAAVHF